MVKVQSWASFSDVCKEADVMLCTVVHCTFLFVTKLNMLTPQSTLTIVRMLFCIVVFPEHHIPVESQSGCFTCLGVQYTLPFNPKFFILKRLYYGNEARLNAVLSMVKLSHCFQDFSLVQPLHKLSHWDHLR